MIFGPDILSRKLLLLQAADGDAKKMKMANQDLLQAVQAHDDHIETCFPLTIL